MEIFDDRAAGEEGFIGIAVLLDERLMELIAGTEDYVVDIANGAPICESNRTI